ncbi:MAG TPA: hypothetical protein VMS76_00615 [Planctomycetota bacterium]|nr:hypothetical protein [Planctomycetota bacterium]
MALALLAVASLPGAAQDDRVTTNAPRQPALSEELQVTSVDLWIGVDRAKLGAWVIGDSSGPRLEPGDVDLRVEGRQVEITGIDPIPLELDPRRLVVFFDTVLSDEASVRWAASRLAERASALAALGEVEVVVADPDPRVVVAATRDAERLASELSGLALFARADAAIPLLRDQFLAAGEEDDSLLLEGGAGGGGAAFDRAIDEGAPGDADPELANAFLEEEIAMVLRRQDLLLRWLVDAGGTPLTRAGRVLVYVSQGFDLNPEDFYLGTAGGGGRLEQETRTWIRTLAAYGWTCLPLVYEDRRASLRRGFRIGKWRFRGLRAGEAAFLGASYEGERDAAKAEALLEVGDAALESGDHQAASGAYLRAIHHFYGDPRTRERQAESWRRLATSLERAGEIDGARRALANALELDPTLEGAADETLAGYTRDVEGLGELAIETGGHLLRSSEDLLPALDEISRRQRLTFTLRGAPSGELLLVELSTTRRGAVSRHARWTRSGAPGRVAVARLRLFLTDAAVEPEVGGDAWLRFAGAPGGPTRATLALPRLDPARSARVLVGTLGEETPPRVAALAPAPDWDDAALQLWQGEIDRSGDLFAAAVYVEDLASGDWNAEVVRLEPE